MKKLLIAFITILTASILFIACGGGEDGGGDGNADTTGTQPVTTIAGLALSYGSADGIGTAARFNLPCGITTDGTNIYVADTYNSTIRKIVISTGAVTTLAGSPGITGSADGIGTAARFKKPIGITNDGVNLYVADTSNSTIRKIVISSGLVTTLTGSAGPGWFSEGTGAAARFAGPTGITTDGTNLYVADTVNCIIRKVVISSALVTTVAGTAGVWGWSDGTGTAARFSYPNGITTDGTNLYVTDSANATIRKIVISTNSVTTLAGTVMTPGSADGTGTAAQFNSPYGITTDGTNLYVADSTNNTIRKIVISTGVVTTFAGAPVPLGGSTDGALTAARFLEPHGITMSGTTLYVADMGNATIRKIH